MATKKMGRFQMKPAHLHPTSYSRDMGRVPTALHFFQHVPARFLVQQFPSECYLSAIALFFSLNVLPIFLSATLKPLLPWTHCDWLAVTSSHFLACQSSWTWLPDLCLDKCCANIGPSHQGNYAHGRDGLGHTFPGYRLGPCWMDQDPPPIQMKPISLPRSCSQRMG